MDISKLDISLFTPTMRLRWLERQFTAPDETGLHCFAGLAHILQQCYTARIDGQLHERWVDVPRSATETVATDRRHRGEM